MTGLFVFRSEDAVNRRVSRVCLVAILSLCALSDDMISLFFPTTI